MQIEIRVTILKRYFPGMNDRRKGGVNANEMALIITITAVKGYLVT
jgi:hypothetical protein